MFSRNDADPVLREMRVEAEIGLIQKQERVTHIPKSRRLGDTYQVVDAARNVKS